MLQDGGEFGVQGEEAGKTGCHEEVCDDGSSALKSDYHHQRYHCYCYHCPDDGVGDAGVYGRKCWGLGG